MLKMAILLSTVDSWAQLGFVDLGSSILKRRSRYLVGTFGVLLLAMNPKELHLVSGAILLKVSLSFVQPLFFGIL